MTLSANVKVMYEQCDCDLYTVTVVLQKKKNDFIRFQRMHTFFSESILGNA